ncbi:ABC transporter ATP-binding protein [Allorhizocola rhizosphaerae]|uniref:ABC transporter ATP-binding protein n=1 Tax=Allorhizocola rhizosphaerae TaxID=1872709 RepID=UPI001B8C7268|nr:ABC transporter ATP-binding protein [Allorhizocola rhizosphaerae]
MAVVQVAGLVKHYGAVKAVDGASLTVAAGEIYALLGLNGAGKTTTIRTLLGMIRPTAGSVRLFGTPVTADARSLWGRVGYLVETPAAYPELTVTENLTLMARLKHLPAAAVGNVVEQLGLRPYAARRARELSLGNQQRLALAKALLGRPELLVLDEPANGLDPAGVTEIRQLLKTLAAQGTTILLSSHILAEVAKLATRIGIIHAGRMVTEIAAADLPHHVARALRVRCHDQDTAARILRQGGYQPLSNLDGMLSMTDERAVWHPDEVATLLVESGCPPVHLAVAEEDLETLFLRLTARGAGA